MEDLKIRLASEKDMSAVMRLIGQPDMSPDNRLTSEEVGKLFKTITSTPYHRLYVVESENSIIGTFALITVQQLSHNGAKSMIIEDIVVSSERQGQGIGKQIMDFAANEAQSNGCYKMILSSGNARTQAHNFYENLGYKRDGIRFAINL